MPSKLPNTPIVNAGILYVDGLAVVYDTISKFKITAGKARDWTDTLDITLPIGVTVNTEFVGVNGLDTGTLQQYRMYSVYVIGDSTGYQPTGGLMSLDQFAPKMPQGYDSFRRIGWIAIDSVYEVIKFYQYGEAETREYIYDSGNPILTVLLNGGSTTLPPSEVILGDIVPRINTEVTFKCKYIQSNATHKANLWPYGASDTAGNIGYTIIGNGTVSTQYTQITCPSRVGSLGFSSLLYTVGASDQLTLVVVGYKDYL